MRKSTFLRSFLSATCLMIGVSGVQAQMGFTNANNRLSNSNFRSGVSITVVDVNNDGLDDIFRMHQGNQLHLELQQRDGTFENHFIVSTSTSSSAWGMAVGDFDHNGWKDVIVGFNGSGRLVMISENGGVITGNMTTLPGSNFFWQNVTLGDFNNDGWLDVYGCDDNAYSKVYMNDGAGNLRLLAHSTTNLTISTGNKTLTVQNNLIFPVGQTVKIGYDAENYMTGNVVSYNSSNGNLVVNVTSVVGSGDYPTWSVHPNIVFNHQLTTIAYSGDPGDSGNYGSVWTDYDGDGDLDLFVAKCRQASQTTTDLRRKDRLFENVGNGNFIDRAGDRGIENTVYNQTWTSSFGDIDNDGDFDLLLTYHDIASKIFENDGNGNFTDITSIHRI
jgi:hypothetical protein